MLIHSNLYSENRVYDTTKEIKAIRQGIIEVMVANDRNTIASSGTLIKEWDIVKFKDGSWFIKGNLFITEKQIKEIIDKIKSLGIVDIKNGVAKIENKNGVKKRYSTTESEDFKRLLSVLEFMDEVELTKVYKINGVSTDRRLHYKERSLGDKYFLHGEEKELIEWAAKNKIWHWLKITEN